MDEMTIPAQPSGVFIRVSEGCGAPDCAVTIVIKEYQQNDETEFDLNRIQVAALIGALRTQAGMLRDEYHTMEELYEHRHILLMALMLSHREMSWRAVTQSDGEMFDGYFLAGMDLPTAQITYHVPLDYWPVLSVPGILTLQRAPAWDGHTPADVLSRLAAWSRAEIRSPADRDTPTVDPRALLAKYIDHVGRCEGVDFLTDRNHGASSVTWTDQEWELLQELRDQEPPA